MDPDDLGLNNNQPPGDERVGHDARQLYYRLWAKHILEIRNAVNAKDYDAWFDILWGYFNMAYPFINEADREEVEKRLDTIEDAREEISMSPGGRDVNLKILADRQRRKLHKQYHKVEQYLNGCLKDKGMLLPLSSGDADDFDIDKLDELSG